MAYPHRAAIPRRAGRPDGVAARNATAQASPVLRDGATSAVSCRGRLSHRLLSVCIGAPILLLSFLGINVRGFTTKNDGLWWWEALLIGCGGGLFLIGVTLIGLHG